METDFAALHGTVRINLELIRRAFDNLYSNMGKYAEPSQPIRLAYRPEQGQVLLRLENAVSAGRDHRESTNIGLNTCRRILRMHEGSFEAKEHDGLFSVELRMPLSRYDE